MTRLVEQHEHATGAVRAGRAERAEAAALRRAQHLVEHLGGGAQLRAHLRGVDDEHDARRAAELLAQPRAQPRMARVVDERHGRRGAAARAG